MHLLLHSAALDLSARKRLHESYISGELCRCESMYHFPIRTFTLYCSFYWFGNKNPSGFALIGCSIPVPCSARVTQRDCLICSSFALWLLRVCGNTQFRWQSELGHSVSPGCEPASLQLGQFYFTFLKKKYIFFYLNWFFFPINGLDETSIQCSFFMSEFPQLTS